jgi:magnesium chelatase family protein
VPEVRRFCAVDPATDALLGEAVSARRLSVRGYHRILRVARTAADLDDSDAIRAEDVALALLLRGEV